MTGKLTIDQAIAIKLTYEKIGYPTPALRTLLRAASKVIEEAAQIAAKEFTDGLCPTCWGDGFNRRSTALLSGPCFDCKGSGRAALKENSADV